MTWGIGRGFRRGIGSGLFLLLAAVTFPAARPVAAKPAPPRETAALVALLNSKGLACTGALVGERYVLTARHCLPIRSAVFGSDVRAPEAIVPVTVAHVPPNRLDLAILELGSPSRVRTLAIAKSPGSFPRLVTIGGFGARDALGTRDSGELRVRSARLFSWGCPPERAMNLGCSPTSDLVIHRGAIEDTCQGDSGAPVLERSSTGDFRIVAVTSRSVRSSLLRCGDGGVYTRIDIAHAWVRSVLGQGARTR